MTKEHPSSPHVSIESLLVHEPDESDASWLDRMHGFLSWQVIPPKASVPFGKSMPDAVLRELSEKKEALLRFIKLRGLIEGDELVRIKGLDVQTSRMLVIESDHPNITALSKNDFHEYFQRKGVYALIFSEFDAVQASYKEELRYRQKHAKAKKF